MILQEAALTLLLLSLATGMSLELVRRAQYEALFKHACFLYVRQRALGGGVARSRHAVFVFLESALGYHRTRSVFIGLHLDERRVPDGLEARVHYRFPSLYRFNRKNHFEVTEKCRFFF